jgi:hypothetical protein
MSHNDISMNDITKFTRMLGVIKKTAAFHPAEVFSKFQDLDEASAGKILRDQLKDEINQLHVEIDHLKQEKEAHLQVLKTYKTLESLGFGLKELKILLNTVKEIAKANGISPGYAIIKFFSEIEDDYDKLLGFKSKLENLRSEIQTEQFKQATIQGQLHDINWASLLRLVQGGQVSEGQNSAMPQEQHEAKIDKNIDYKSTIHTPKDANLGATLVTQAKAETKNSLQQSKIENEDEPTDEQVHDFQERLRNKYKTDRDVDENPSLYTQGTTKESHEQSKSS